MRYILHKITSDEVNRIPLIALKYYRNHTYWWMIAGANDFTDPFTTPPEGTEIKVPYISDIVNRYNVLM